LLLEVMETQGTSRSKTASLVAINRQARNAATNLDPVLDILADAGELEVVDIESGASLVPQLRAALRRGVDRIVLGGGDGTINSVLPLLLEHRVPLGVLPLGTANDLARTLDLPSNPVEAAKVIVAGHTCRIDVASVNDKPFLNAAGLGFSTTLHRALAPRTKRVLGPLAYPLGVLKHWRSHRPFNVELEIEGIRRSHRAIQVTIANGRFYGGGATAHEGAAIDDGLLDVVLVPPRPLHRFVLKLPRLRSGRYEDSPVVTYRAAELSLHTRHRKAISTDGEESTQTPAQFRVQPRALEVFVADGARRGAAAR
jgi:YegS/Rv2252/BmrU family lipid kinase